MAEAQVGLVVDGVSELLKTLKHAPKDVRLGIRSELRSLGEPVRSTAERLAATEIPKSRPRWSKFRTGVTQAGVYVAPRERGVKTKGRDRLRRPSFGTLLARRASQPALRANEWRIRKDVEADARPARDEVEPRGQRAA